MIMQNAPSTQNVADCLSWRKRDDIMSSERPHGFIFPFHLINIYAQRSYGWSMSLPHLVGAQICGPLVSRSLCEHRDILLWCRRHFRFRFDEKFGSCLQGASFELCHPKKFDNGWFHSFVLYWFFFYVCVFDLIKG